MIKDELEGQVSLRKYALLAPTDLLVPSNPNPSYEADRLAGIQILRELSILDQHSSGPLVVPSAVAAMRDTHTRETEA